MPSRHCARIDRAGRVVRRVDEDRARVGPQRLLDRLGARLEAVLGRGLDDGEIRAGGAEGAGIGRVVGRDHDRVVAGVEHALHGGVERGLAARRGDDLVGAGRRRRCSASRSAPSPRAGAGCREAACSDGGRPRTAVTQASTVSDGVSKSWSPTDSMMMSSPACLRVHGGEMHLPAVLAGRHDAGNAGRGSRHH